jgi:serine/threonine protein phosphatase 1
VGRTFVIGDVHGERAMLDRVLGKLPFIAPDDTLVLLGDYLDRGPDSRGVIERVRRLPEQTAGNVVALRGNHEDAYLRCLAGDADAGFLLARGNGVAEAFRSFTDREVVPGAPLADTELVALLDVPAWVPLPVARWLAGLPLWYEDEHAIYVHAGLVEKDGKWVHPRDTENPTQLLWVRTMRFFQGYRGKRVVCGHTATENLPPELSSFTPEDPLDMWVGENVVVIDTGSGKGGFLTILELPALKTYESR